MICITNFNNSRKLSDIKAQFDNVGYTNLELLIADFAAGNTFWSAPKNALPGDIVVFMCAKEARHNLGMATSHIPDSFGNDFKIFVDKQKALYKKYSGCLLGYGVISSAPIPDAKFGQMAEIDQLKAFLVPIHIDEFRSFISISKTNAITYINNEQWERLKWLVNQKNPDFFLNVTPPNAETLTQEFEDAVQKASAKSIDQLKKTAEKNASQPISSSVLTKIYNRDPVIAAYVKKRADGYCQLCGMKAPFNDKNKEPYLECHHIDWLSKGGKDSADNCVALCPNCHRKMHALNAQEDIDDLKKKIQ